MAADVLTYNYLRQSALLEDGSLDLQTSRGRTTSGQVAHPRFFTGFLTYPEPSSRALLAVANVAGARYFVPMTAKRLAEIRDPVVTSSPDRLRFESFSACCGVYARYDVLGAGLDGEFLAQGTTNVDVNGPLREALARVGSRAPLHLAVGPESLEVTTLDDAVVERKVALPQRWVRGFAEAAVLLARMDLRGEVEPLQARQFLRSLPKVSTAGAVWAEASGGRLRVTARPSPASVCLAGPERLRTLEPLLRFATALRIYGPPATDDAAASTWELTLPGGRLLLTLSPDATRGFSGEGAALVALATDDAADDADAVAAALGWDATIDVTELAAHTCLPVARIRAALVQLGSAGQVGYDVADAAYFHRELPYDALTIQRANPRLRNARALVEAGAVEIDGALATITGVNGEQHIRLHQDGSMTCTCLWWAKYGGTRGPCKHVLAVGMTVHG